ncbi:hypothetical protein TWF225_002979 [Orbilia oligospora]|nr:hypothetical protein TWF225_002979 [Orbilia oligospora]KAF3267935.1 hypothetical protein TWF217_011657 [Orbilia oligospora]KAF3269665.1 hypothetical protein TWF128_005855 [Orbilia oligospora]
MATTALRGRQRLYDVVSPEVAQFFEERGLFHPVVNNRRKISPSTISPSCSSSSVCSSGYLCHLTPTHFVDGTNHFTSATISEPCDFVEVPVFLESRETLEFVGFCPERAEYIWDLWSKITMHDMHVFNFIDFALDFIPDPGLRRARTEAINEKDGWKEMSLAYRALESLAQQFEESVKFFQYPEHKKDGKSEGLVPWRELHDFTITEPEKSTSTIFGTLRGDLGGSDPVTYWTPQKAVADIYAGYLKRRIPIAQVIITEVEFSEELAAPVDLVSLWGTIEGGDKINPPFQEYTSSCRKGIDYRVPQYLRYLEHVDVITANILSHKNIGHRERDSWKEIQPSDLVRIKIDGEDRLGIQWVFKSDEARTAFEEHCRGKVTQYNLDRLLTVASKTERSLSSATG